MPKSRMKTANVQGKVHTTADTAVDERFGHMNSAEERLLVQEEQLDTLH